MINNKYFQLLDGAVYTVIFIQISVLAPLKMYNVYNYIIFIYSMITLFIILDSYNM